MSYFVVNEKCNGCLACVQNCPADALSSKDTDDQRTLLHNMTRCARCGTCWRVCPQEAIEFQYLMENDWNEVVTLNLLRCRVCGDPLYTANFGETLSERLHQEFDPLCPSHRQAISSLARAHFFPGPGSQPEEEK
ncbi:MAG: 4Fe-4S dicluster domain-containing protein [Desulfobacterales bacterium]|jgi:formate hydrogenlyase subunit 6/NADH:ubiquinone oxidoreductase subunit I